MSQIDIVSTAVAAYACGFLVLSAGALAYLAEPLSARILLTTVMAGALCGLFWVL